jgi:hypothetical protein
MDLRESTMKHLDSLLKRKIGPSIQNVLIKKELYMLLCKLSLRLGLERAVLLLSLDTEGYKRGDIAIGDVSKFGNGCIIQYRLGAFIVR